MMSVVQVDYYCSYCGFERTYHVGEEVPQQCPQCGVASGPRSTWLRANAPFLPVLAFMIIFPSLLAYDVLTVGIRGGSPWWQPFALGLMVFGVGWFFATLLLHWPKPYRGPNIVPVIQWPKQNASPQEIVGFNILLTLEEHLPRRPTFETIIESSRPVLSENEGDFWKNDRIYILGRREENLGSLVAQGPFLFHPEWAQFKRGAMRRLMKKYHGSFSHRPSIEEMLLNPEGCPFKRIYGSVWKDGTRNLKVVSKSVLSPSDLGFPNGYGRVTVSKRKESHVD